MEAILSISDEIKFLLVNTDGLEILCPKNKEKDVIQASLDFMTRLGFAIDVKKYKSLIIKNVNEYIGEYDDSSVEKEHLKLKGCFEIDKEIQKDVSARIIPIALKEYFINEKIPADMRNSVLLLAQEEKILWVIGGRISADIKVSEDTRQILKVQIIGGKYHEG